MPDSFSGIFELVGERIIPRLPRIGGVFVQPDGKRYLSVEQCVERQGHDVEFWKQEWMLQHGDLLRATDGPLSPDKVSAAIDQAADDVIRQTRFPKMSDVHWAFVKRFCERNRLDVMKVWVTYGVDDETGVTEPRVFIGLADMRRITQLNGLRGSESSIEYCDTEGNWSPAPWLNDDMPPKAARVYVTRADTGEASEGLAEWRKFVRVKVAESGDVEYVSHWDPKTGGPFQLGKCALAMGYRAAFPELFDRIYTTDEFVIPRREKTKQRADDTDEYVGSRPDEPALVKMEVPAKSPSAVPIPDDPRAAWDLVDDSTPDLQGLPHDLFRRYDMSKAESEAFIQRCAKIWPNLYRRHGQAFAAVALRQAEKEHGAALAAV